MRLLARRARARRLHALLQHHPTRGTLCRAREPARRQPDARRPVSKRARVRGGRAARLVGPLGRGEANNQPATRRVPQPRARDRRGARRGEGGRLALLHVHRPRRGALGHLGRQRRGLALLADAQRASAAIWCQARRVARSGRPRWQSHVIRRARSLARRPKPVRVAAARTPTFEGKLRTRLFFPS